MVANEQLPEAVARIRAGEDPGPITPIDVTTHEEVGQLARAVDDLHRQAVTLACRARPPAVAGQRNVHHAVAPQHLSDQPAARPDRDAREGRGGSQAAREPVPTRPPRGADASYRRQPARPRRRARPTPRAEDDLTVASSLQAATAGVQDYQRVRVGTASNAHISDAAAADVVHLLTELVDNALAYSAPTTTVAGISSTTGPNGVTVEIEDAGLGIPDACPGRDQRDPARAVPTSPPTPPAEWACSWSAGSPSAMASRCRCSATIRRHDRRQSCSLRASWTSQADEPRAPPQPGDDAAAGPAAARADSPDHDRTARASRSGSTAPWAYLPRRQPGAQAPQTAPTGCAACQSPSRPAAPRQVPPPPVRRTATDSQPPAVAPPSAVVAPLPQYRPPAAAVPSPRPLLPLRRQQRPLPPPMSPAAWRRRQLPVRSPSEQLPRSRCNRPQRPADYDNLPPSPRRRRPHAPHRRRPRRSRLADSEAEAETPIFKALRSAWLSADATAGDLAIVGDRGRLGTRPIGSPTR